jgi:hypothetical protein
MLDNSFQQTFGEKYLERIEKTETKGQIFAVLEDAAASRYPEYNLYNQAKNISDFNSVSAYQDKLARVRIEYNSKAVKNIHERLRGLANFGEDNYKYKEKMIRKLNLLINNYPTIDDIVYIAMSAYINKGYGSCKKFKKELRQHIKDGLIYQI